MANSLVDTVTGYLTPDVMQKISSFIGESPSATQKTMESIVPMILTQAAELSSSPDGANQLGNLISQGRDGNLLTNLSGQLNSDTATQSILNSGGGILNTLFGGKLSSVIEAITSALGMKGASVSSLLKIAAPLVLGVLAKERSTRGLGNSGLASLLTEQKDSLARLVPSGLAGLLGMGSGALRQVTALGSAHPYETRKNDQWWLWPVLGLAALLLLALAFWGRDTGIKPGSGKPALASIAKLTLPGGKVLSVTEGSFYHSLAGFLANASDTTVGKSFVFDNLNFEFGTA
ncbi:MAG TPA: DUF937 domain-containing protein, partial [Candidatus Binatia bacterium]|nr:DUF937 domain-containing protein [Candidatus Binatia bacterium]